MTLSLEIIYAARHLLSLGHSIVADDPPSLSESDLSVLLSIYDEPGLTAKDLVSRLSRDKTTISRSVSRLLKGRFLRSEIDSLDGRRRNLFVTDSGRELTNRATIQLGEDIGRLTGRMPLENVEMIDDFLRRLREGR